MNKPILYYSQNCSYSTEILDLMKTSNMLDQYELTCIDSMRKLPAFIDRVPILFHNNKVLHDEGLFNYMEHVSKPTASVEAFTLDTSISDQFSFIGGDGAQNSNMNQSFLEISDQGEFRDQKIETPSEMEENMNKKCSLDDLINAREKDLKHI